MPCPYFRPTEPLPWPLWRGRLRPPLGEPYSGECLAIAHEPQAPPQDMLLECCNLGYARSKCDRLPHDGPDAIQLSIGPGATVRHILEQDGQLLDTGTIEAPTDGPSALEAQSRALLRSHARSGHARSGHARSVLKLDDIVP